MRILMILILGIMISGCCTQKRCITKFPPQTVIERSDTTIYRDSVVYHDIVIRDTIEADTVFIERKIPVELPAMKKIEPLTLDNRYARAHAWVEDGKLKLQLETKEQVIQKIVVDAKKEAYYWEAKYRTEKRKDTQIVYKAKPIHKIAVWFSILVLIVGGVALYLRLPIPRR